MTDPKIFYIWYSEFFGYGTARSHELIEQFETAEQVYNAISDYETAKQYFTAEERARLGSISLNFAQKLYNRAISEGCGVLTPECKNYPVLLHNIYAKPMAIYYKGNPAALNSGLCICMVGSRKMTEYGAVVSDKLATQLSNYGIIVVSGMAIGIDQACHKATIKAEGITVGVLGCGIDVDYPKNTLPIRDVIVKTGGLIISEFPMGVQPDKSHFPIRNRILSGVSSGVVVVEAEAKSGTMLTASIALEQNRQIFAVPGRITDKNSIGCLHLIADGATPVLEAMDIISPFFQVQKVILSSQNKPDENKPDLPKTTPSDKIQEQQITPEISIQEPIAVKTSFEINLTEDEKNLLKIITSNPILFDEIAFKSELPVDKLLTILTNLEIYGCITSHSGRRFSLVSQMEE